MNLLRALRHRNFALFLSGQICALIGYWIQQVALSWLVYRLTGSATLLGVLAFASNLPVLLLAPFAGLWSDRFNRHRMMLATQVLEMLQAVVLTALAFSGAIEIWHIIVLTTLLEAHHSGDEDASDDATLVERVGGLVAVVPGEPTNLKITYPEDLVVAEAGLR